MSGSAIQATPVSFNRRFLMKDGKVRTWATLKDPNVVHAAGPIDPEIGIIQFQDVEVFVEPSLGFYFRGRRYFATASSPICLPMAVPTAPETTQCAHGYSGCRGYR